MMALTHNREHVCKCVPCLTLCDLVVQIQIGSGLSGNILTGSDLLTKAVNQANV